jgi:hypothetical protein
MRPTYNSIAILSLAFAVLIAMSCHTVGQTMVLQGDLYEAPEGFPKCNLSNLRVERGAGCVVLVFDYEIFDPSKSMIPFVTGRPKFCIRSDASENIPARTPQFTMERGSGAMRIELWDLELEEAKKGIEVYVYKFVSDPKSQVNRLLISNPVRVGSLESNLAVKPWDEIKDSLPPTFLLSLGLRGEPNRPKENGAATNGVPIDSVPKDVLPEDVPDGYARTEFSTYLTPGTPIMYAKYGNWLPGVVVEKNGDITLICTQGNLEILRFRDPNWIVVADDVREKVQQKDNPYTLDVLVMPGARFALRDAVPAKG